MNSECTNIVLMKFIEAQESLPQCMARLLHDNLWDLYEHDQPHSDAASNTDGCLAGLK